MYETSLKNFVLRVGLGYSQNKLNAFDRALVVAGISDYNIIKVSSVLPPNCLRQNGIILSKGSLLPSAFAVTYSNTIGETISAAVAVAIPFNKSDIGVIMEHSSFSNKNRTETMVRLMAEQAMNDRKVAFSEIISTSVEYLVATSDIHCAFATVSMW